MRRIGVVLLGSGLLLAGCGGATAGDEPAAATSSGPEDVTEAICDDFAEFVQDGRPQADRQDVVDSVVERVDGATQELKNTYDVLVNTVDANSDAQQLADDTFAASCFDAGWDG